MCSKHILADIALAVVGLLALLSTRAQELPPNRFLRKIADRERYSEIICSATVLTASPVGNAVTLEGKERSQRAVMARVDHVFKGTLDEKIIEFKYYGFPISTGTTEQLSLPTANFRAGIRYVLFLDRHDQNLEPADPPFRMEIELASEPARPTGSIGTLDVALADELILAIESAPTTIGRAATQYFDWTEELIGRQRSISRVEPFLNSRDPLVRYQTAWWLSFRKVDGAVTDVLKSTSQDDNVEQWARFGARDRLRDMAEGRYLP
jgi:hypothetical protein